MTPTSNALFIPSFPIILQPLLQVADIFIYTALAWYFSQVWFTKVGVPKPWYFPLKPSYWFPKSQLEAQLQPASSEENEVEVKEVLEVLEEGSNAAAAGVGGVPPIPTEPVDESITGNPTVIVQKLCKSFGVQKVLNDLSFNMYENQIFALLGHNGAGKVSFHVLK